MAQTPRLAGRERRVGEREGGKAGGPEGWGGGPDPTPAPMLNGGLQLHAPEELQSELGSGSESQRTPSHRSCTTDEFDECAGLGGRDNAAEMEAGGDIIPLAAQDPSQSQSNDRLTDSTVFSLSQSESLWTTETARSAWEIYQYPILLLASGGAVFICGFVLSGLFFAGMSEKATKILGPALLSIGLMVLVVGLVLFPITKENLKPPRKRPMSYYRPPHFNL